MRLLPFAPNNRHFVVYLSCLLLWLVCSSNNETNASNESASVNVTFLEPNFSSLRTELFVHSATQLRTTSMKNITLVTHATLDRLADCARWCRQYQGPLSVSLFIRPFQDSRDNVLAAFLAVDCLFDNADLHLVWMDISRRSEAFTNLSFGAEEPESQATFDDSTQHDPLGMMAHYPFNVQRNAAMDGVVGQLVFAVDIDFRLMPPSVNEEALRRNYFLGLEAVVEDYTSSASAADILDDVSSRACAAVYIVPAVETIAAGAIPLPTTLAELKESLMDGTVCPFYGHHCRQCHLPSNIRKFVRSQRPYQVHYIQNYEPYAILNRSSISKVRCDHSTTIQSFSFPRYNETFVGRGFSKMSFFFELHQQARPFVVLPNIFLVHAGRGNIFKMEMAEWVKDNRTIDQEGLEYYDRQERNKRCYSDFVNRTKARYELACRNATLTDARDEL